MPFLLHPLLVHFPIALLCVACLWTFFRQEESDHDTAWRLWCIGTAAAVIASSVGIYEHFPHRRGALAQPLMEHQLWGLAVSLAALAWAMWRGYQRHLGKEDPARQTWGRALGILIAFGTLIAASTGGALILEHGLGQTPSQKAQAKGR